MQPSSSRFSLTPAHLKCPSAGYPFVVDIWGIPSFAASISPPIRAGLDRTMSNFSCSSFRIKSLFFNTYRHASTLVPVEFKNFSPPWKNKLMWTLLVIFLQQTRTYMSAAKRLTYHFFKDWYFFGSHWILTNMFQQNLWFYRNVYSSGLK